MYLYNVLFAVFFPQGFWIAGSRGVYALWAMFGLVLAGGEKGDGVGIYSTAYRSPRLLDIPGFSYLRMQIDGLW